MWSVNNNTERALNVKRLRSRIPMDARLQMVQDEKGSWKYKEEGRIFVLLFSVSKGYASHSATGLGCLNPILALLGPNQLAG